MFWRFTQFRGTDRVVPLNEVAAAYTLEFTFTSRATMRSPRRLTISLIESVQRGDRGDRWLSDNDGSRGHGRLVVRVGTHTRRFYFKYSLGGRVKLIPLGRHSRTEADGFVTLEQARALARRHSVNLCDETSSQVGQVAAVRSQAVVPNLPASSTSPPSSTASAGISLVDLCNAYAEHLENRGSHKSALGALCDIRNYVANTEYAKIAANKLTTEAIVDLMRAVKEKCSFNKANRIRAHLSAAYAVAQSASTDASVSADLKRFGIVTNPVASTKKMRKLKVEKCPEAPRPKRFLSAIELGHFWLALANTPDTGKLPYSAVRLTVLLGGQRCEQLLAAYASWVDLDARTITIFDSKGNREEPREHCLPLTDRALEEVAPLMKSFERTREPFLFAGRTKGTHLSSGLVSAAVRQISDHLVHSELIKKPFRYRHIRGTIESRMSELGIAKEIRAQLQSHDMGGVQMKFYHDATLLQLKLDALVRWEHFLAECAEKAKDQTTRVSEALKL